MIEMGIPIEINPSPIAEVFKYLSELNPPFL